MECRTYCVFCQKETRLNRDFSLTHRSIHCFVIQAFGDIDLTNRQEEFICLECAFILKSLIKYLDDLSKVFKGYTKINIPEHFKGLKVCLNMINEDYNHSVEIRKSAINGNVSVPPEYHQHNSPEVVADNATESSDDSNNQSETDMEISRINKTSQHQKKRKRNTRSISAVSVTTVKSPYKPRRSHTRNSLRSANTPASIRYFTQSVGGTFICNDSNCYSRYKTFDELAEHVQEDHHHYEFNYSDDSNNQSETDTEISKTKKSQPQEKKKGNTRSKSAVSVTTLKSPYKPKRFDELAEHVQEDHHHYEFNYSDDFNNQSETDMEKSKNNKSQRQKKRKRNTRSKSAVSVTTVKSPNKPRRSRTRNSLRFANTPASIRYFTRSVTSSFLCDVSKCYSRYKTFDELAEHVQEDHHHYDKYWESTYDSLAKMELDEVMQKYNNNPPPRYLEYKYPCVLQYCSNSFINIDDLATHKIEKHSLLITLRCRECYSQGYTSRKDFDVHYKLTHKRMQEEMSAIHKFCILEDEAEKNKTNDLI